MTINANYDYKFKKQDLARHSKGLDGINFTNARRAWDDRRRGCCRVESFEILRKNVEIFVGCCCGADDFWKSCRFSTLLLRLSRDLSHLQRTRQNGIIVHFFSHLATKFPSLHFLRRPFAESFFRARRNFSHNVSQSIFLTLMIFRISCIKHLFVEKKNENGKRELNCNIFLARNFLSFGIFSHSFGNGNNYTKNYRLCCLQKLNFSFFTLINEENCIFIAFSSNLNFLNRKPFLFQFLKPLPSRNHVNSIVILFCAD